jgi:hypothetical protein
MYVPVAPGLAGVALGEIRFNHRRRNHMKKRLKVLLAICVWVWLIPLTYAQDQLPVPDYETTFLEGWEYGTFWGFMSLCIPWMIAQILPAASSEKTLLRPDTIAAGSQNRTLILPGDRVLRANGISNQVMHMKTSTA